MKKNKILAAIIALVVVCSVLALAACNITSADGKWEYSVDKETNTATIVSYKGGDAELVIPSEIDGVAVTKIGKNAFKKNTKITSLVLPDSLIEIEQSAFEMCSNINKITFGSGLKTIGMYAFYNCYELKDISLPSNLEMINNGAFMGCALKNVTVPASVKYVGHNVFARNGYLKTDSNNVFYYEYLIESITFESATTLLKFGTTEGANGYDEEAQNSLKNAQCALNGITKFKMSEASKEYTYNDNFKIYAPAGESEEVPVDENGNALTYKWVSPQKLCNMFNMPDTGYDKDFVEKNTKDMSKTDKEKWVSDHKKEIWINNLRDSDYNLSEHFILI